MPVRTVFALLHRWIGLGLAGFLLVVALTGSLLAFLPELDRWLTPELYPGPHGQNLGAAALARRAEALVPRGRAEIVFFEDKFSTTGTARVVMGAAPGEPPLEFDSLFLDSVTGAELGRLHWGGLPHSVGQVMPFIYDLHMNLASGHYGGRALGVVALFWTFDCFVAAWLTLPAAGRRPAPGFLARWAPAWRIKWRAAPFRIAFDLHRAGGLWLWGMLIVFAWSAVFFNFVEVYAPVTKLLADFDDSAWSTAHSSTETDGRKQLDWEDAQVIAERLMAEEADRLGFAIERPISLSIDAAGGEWEYCVHSSLDVGDKLGSTILRFNAYDGSLRSLRLPTGQRSGDTFTAWLVALHTANIFGLPYKILVCALGLAIAILSGTGVYIWAKKRAARRQSGRRESYADRQLLDSARAAARPGPVTQK